MRRTNLLLLSLFAFSAVCLNAGLETSTESEVAAPKYGLSSGYWSSPLIASSPDTHLVVWNHGDRIARLDAKGRPLDVPPIRRPMERTHAYRSGSDLVWTGEQFVLASVVCQDCYVPPRAPWRRFLELTFFDARGVQQKALAVGEVVGDTIAMAASVDGFIVAVAGYLQTEVLSLTREGGLRSRRVLADNGYREPGLDIASGPNGALLVWSKEKIVEAVRLTATGDSQDATPFFIGAGVEPAVTWNGNAYVVAFANDRELMMSNVTLDGNVLSERSLFRSARGVAGPSLWWNGSSMQVAWKEVTGPEEPTCLAGGDVIFYVPCAPVAALTARLGDDGVLQPAESLGEWSGSYGRLTATDRVALTTSGAHALVVWREVSRPGYGYDIYARILDDDNDDDNDDNHRGRRTASAWRLTSQLVSRTASWRSGASTARNGEGALVAWLESPQRYTDRSLRIARFDRTGARLGEARQLSARASWPATAWNGTDTFVVWPEGASGAAQTLRAVRVGADGTVSAPPVSIATQYYMSTAIGCSPAECLVVWSDHSRIFGKRLSASGAILDEAPQVIGASSYPVAVAWTGESFLVVGSYPASGAFVRDGRAGAPFSISVGPDTRPTGAACNSVDCLVAIFEGPAVRVDHDGNLRPAQQQTPGLRFALDWTGTRYLAVGTKECTLVGGYFDRDGNFTDATPLRAYDGRDCAGFASLIARPDGTGFVAFTQWSVTEPWYEPERVLVRTIEDR